MQPLESTPESSDDRRKPGCIELRADGRRMLTVAEVAVCVRGQVEYVYKLIRQQREEDLESQTQCRAPRRVGLRATQCSPRKTLVCEQEVWAFLHERRP